MTLTKHAMHLNSRPLVSSRYLLRTGLALLVPALTACGSTTWMSAHEAAKDGPSRIAEAELALIAGDDAATAATLSEAILGDASRSPDDRLRAFSTLIVASDAMGAIERPLVHLPGALATAIAADAPDYAERFVAQAPRAWARLDGRPASSADVRDALLAVTRTKGDRWEPARSLAHRELIAGLRLQSGPSTALAAAKEAGFLTEWRLSCPWGDAPLIDFDEVQAPESRALNAFESTGHGYALAPTPTTRGTFSDGEVVFFDQPAVGAVCFAEATLNTFDPADAGAVVMRLESNRLARVFITTDSTTEVMARRDLDAPWLTEAVVPVAAASTPPKKTRITVKFASYDGKGFFRLQVAPRASSAALPHHASSDLRDVRDVRIGDGRAAIAALVALERRLARPIWDPRGASAEVDRLTAIIGPHPTLSLLAARLALGDVTAPDSERRESARRHYSAVLAATPNHPVALRGLARIEREEERPDQALELLSKGNALDPRTALELLDLLRSRGWEVESLRIVESLLPLASTSPRVSQELIDTYRTFGRIPEAQHLAEQLEIAFPGTGAERLGELAQDRGNPPAAKLAALYQAEPQRHSALRNAVAALRANGDLDQARALLTTFLTDRPNDGWALGELARIALQTGDFAAAIARSHEVLAVHPDFAPFEGLVSHLSDEPERFDRLDSGPEKVAAYRAFSASPEGQANAPFPVVTILDKTAIEVRRDGSTLELAHKIRMVQSKQGADALGDVLPPDGARLLVARTLKRDGRILEPERTEGKAELSFPELEPGDAIETAWVSRSRVSPAEGGYLTGVSFGSFGPVHELLATFIAAPGLALEVTPFGNAPPATRATLADGRTSLSWSITKLSPIPREPLTVSARSFFPFADLRVTRSDESDAAKAWRRIARSYASRLTRLLTPGPRTASRLETLQKAKDPVLAAFAFAKSDINDMEQLNAFDTTVEVALASRKGNRTLVLAGLLMALSKARPDTSAELIVCAPERDGRPEDRASPTPNANRFFYPLVVWRDAKRTLYLDPSRPYTPLGDLPAELDGVACLSPMRHADTAGPFVDLSAEGNARIAASAFTISLDLTMTAAGDAVGTLVGYAQGASASPLRQAFLAQDDERKRIIFEQWLATLLTGANLVDVKVEDADEAEKPMRFTLIIEVPGYGRPDAAGGLDISRLMKPVAASDFAGVPDLAQLVGAPTRATPLRLLPYTEEVTIKLSWPGELDVALSPPELTTSQPGLTLSQQVEPRAGSKKSLTVSRRVDIAPGRVTPADYPAFRQAVADALRALESPLRLQRR